MLYTAVTRAQTQVVLLGNCKDLEKAIEDAPSADLRKTGGHLRDM
jgi:ATP-dependent exoDNAse (exonuclease V) alpha subunit